MLFGQVFFIEFVLYLPKWASGDKNIKNRIHVAPCKVL